jgi:Sec-independent protein secretion pathway component TatC
MKCHDAGELGELGAVSAGFVMHFWLQAKASVSSQSKGLKSVREGLALTWPVSLVRLFLCGVAFGLWMSTPEMFSKLLATLTGGAVTHSVPSNRETIALFGYVAGFDAG